MSKLMLLAVASLAATVVAPIASAQASRPGITVSPVRGVVATPGRPTVVDRVPIRPHRGGDDRDGNLRERLRNACFSEPNPPAPLCRRVFGDQGAGGRTAG